MRDLLPAAEVLAKGVKHVACYVAEALAERRKAFDDDEAGDYLRCAGADALAECLQTSGAADIPAGASDGPAGGEATAYIPLGATCPPGHSTSDLLVAAAKWFEYTSDRDITGVIGELAMDMRDRAAQFAAHGD